MYLEKKCYFLTQSNEQPFDKNASQKIWGKEVYTRVKLASALSNGMTNHRSSTESSKAPFYLWLNSM